MVKNLKCFTVFYQVICYQCKQINYNTSLDFLFHWLYFDHKFRNLMVQTFAGSSLI